MAPFLPAGTSFEFLQLTANDFPLALWSVVIAKEPQFDRTRVYRIVALPGERVRLDHHGLRVDGTTRLPPMPDITYRFRDPNFEHGNRKYYQVPDHSYFLLCDTVTVAVDSRNFGAVHESSIKGLFERRR